MTTGQKLALNAIYERVCGRISLADFVVLAAEATMAATSKAPEATKEVFKNAFRWGRTTARECAYVQGRLPAAEEGCTGEAEKSGPPSAACTSALNDSASTRERATVQRPRSVLQSR